MNCGTRVGFGQHKARNEPACRWCKEWFRKEREGLVVVAPIKAPKPPKAAKKAKPKPEPRGRRRAECGTTAAFHGHVNRGETIDEECRTAYRAYQRETYAKRQAKKGGTVKPPQEAAPKPHFDPTAPRREISHGTTAGYQAHKRRDEQPCEPCLEALREKSKRGRASAPKKPRVRKLLPCGTAAAYLRHLRDNEEACPPCREAQRLDSIAKRARKIEREGGPRPHAGRKPINHGTTAGRAQHIRRGEAPCRPCVDAFNAYNRAYSASARKKAKAQQ